MLSSCDWCEPKADIAPILSQLEMAVVATKVFWLYAVTESFLDWPEKG